MFANNSGNKAIAISPFYKTADQSEDAKVYTSPTIDIKTGIIYLKLVNSENVAKETTVQINGSANKNYKVTLEYLSSDDTSIKNQGDKNFYSSAPDVKSFNYNEAITPKTKDLGVVSGSFKINIPVNSVNIIKLTPTN
jgi:alpha-L-arabinofuranosidase